MSRTMGIGLLSLVIVLALVYYFAREQTPLVGGRGVTAPLATATAAKCLANQRILKTAVAAYRMSHQGQNPYVLQDLVPTHVRTMPQCPDGGSYVYDSESGTVSCPNGHGGRR